MARKCLWCVYGVTSSKREVILAQNTKCACAGYNTMHCEQGSSTIVIDSSDLDSFDIFEDPQSSTDAR